MFSIIFTTSPLAKSWIRAWHPCNDIANVLAADLSQLLTRVHERICTVAMINDQKNTRTPMTCTNWKSAPQPRIPSRRSYIL